MLTYPWKCTVWHCNHLGNTWKPLVLMTRHFDYCPSASKGDNQSVRSSAPVVSRCFPGGYNVKLYISRGRLAWWLLAFLHSDRPSHKHIHTHTQRNIGTKRLWMYKKRCLLWILCGKLPIFKWHRQWWYMKWTWRIGSWTQYGIIWYEECLKVSNKQRLVLNCYRNDSIVPILHRYTQNSEVNLSACIPSVSMRCYTKQALR